MLSFPPFCLHVHLFPQFNHPPSAEVEAIAVAILHDRMTEQRFPHPIESFSPDSIPAPLQGPIDILTEGRPALEKANRELGEQGSLEEGVAPGTRPVWVLGLGLCGLTISLSRFVS